MIITADITEGQVAALIRAKHNSRELGFEAGSVINTRIANPKKAPEYRQYLITVKETGASLKYILKQLVKPVPVELELPLPSRKQQTL